MLLLWTAVMFADAGSKACASCHAEIYSKYMRTGMARSSGRVGDGFERFDSADFGGNYSVTKGFVVIHPRGSFPMQFFIGSGAVGRSYAGLVDGFLFQSPASYYSARKAWDLSPGYAAKPFVDVARPIENACLQCHASGSKLVAGTVNRYAPEFVEGGVSCERCHGSGEAHVASSGGSAMVNPAKLPPARRDSVCLQCHLTGAARVAQPGRGPQTFRAGDLLSDHVKVFVSGQPGAERAAATDHAEQLSRSKCQQASAGKLWCGICHEVHTGEVRQNTCQGCHAAPSHKSAAVGSDCAGCHMPKGRTREGEHVVYTDHSIARRGGNPKTTVASLQPFPGMTASPRDWALAEPSKHLPLLEKLAAEPMVDAEVLVQLAQLYDAKGKGAPLYERALRLQPGLATAQSNLAIYRIRQGRVDEALALWSKAFANNPAMLSAGLNLATGQLQVGDKAGAESTLRRVLRFHPDSSQARQMLAELR